MKKPIQFINLREITDLQDIAGNHPNQAADSGFVYLECDKAYFEENFEKLFDFEKEIPTDHCFLSENCELSYADRLFCGVSFKGDLGKEAITQILKQRLNELNIAFAEIANNSLITSSYEIISLTECKAIEYDYK